MKIYTRQGDSGETSLPSGRKVSKTSLIVEALGVLDECNAAIGVAISLIPKDAELSSYRQQLITIQRDLFEVGASLEITPYSTFNSAETIKLEDWIDKMEQKLPSLRGFILPGGHPASASLHLARSLCRRAERVAWSLTENKEALEKILPYLNRLSDYLFVASRTFNHFSKVEEIPWKS